MGGATYYAYSLYLTMHDSQGDRCEPYIDDPLHLHEFFKYSVFKNIYHQVPSHTMDSGQEIFQCKVDNLTDAEKNRLPPLP